MRSKQGLQSIQRSKSVAVAAALSVAVALGVFPRPDYAGDIAQSPLYLTTTVPPVVMFSMSNDHQLFQKAYSDFSDVTGDGLIDITYADSNDYYGYFDSNRCYSYSTNRFVPGAAATGANNHHCAGTAWSGNFLNWASMTRMDVVRKIIYGGKRSTDSTTQTVLERATLPDDVHAFGKILDTGENQLYTPFTDSPLTVCNFTNGADGEWSHTTTQPPVLRIAAGEWPQWATSEIQQCTWGVQAGHAAASDSIGAGEYVVRVEVCVADKLEDDCETYDDGSGNSVYKPIGVMQQYGEDEELPIRFGLVSGSFGKKAKGGVLRSRAKNVIGNTDSADDEVLSDGTFSGNPGIVSTLDAFRVVGRDYDANQYRNLGNGWDCSDNYDLLKDEFLAVDNRCPSWGNPVAEIYLETLRYLAASGGEPDDATAASPTTDFDAYAGSTPDSEVLPDLVETTWDDPIESDQYCAKSHVVLISTASNSFDKDQLSGASDIGLSGTALADKTDEIGDLEGISGNDFFVGDGFVCSAQTISSLAGVTGVCPTVPGLDGGYEVAGLAFHANTTDFRSPAEIEQRVETFAIALARDLPEFSIPVGDGVISFVPIAGADNENSATVPDKAESMVDVLIKEWNTNTDGEPVSGRIWVTWEDSSWGEDYDLDNIQQIEFCVGAECDPTANSTGFITSCHADGPYPEIRPDPDDDRTPPDFVGQDVFNPTTDIANNQLMLCTGFLALYAGHSNMVGYAITGSTDDGTKLPRVIQPHDSWGPSDGFWSVIAGDDVGSAGDAVWEVYTPGSTAAGLLKSPLWYAAKYGGFKDLDDSGTPNNDNEWDVDADGEPDNYFLADNPGLLGPRLARFLDTTLQESSAASVAANSLSKETDAYVYQARFSSEYWSGDLVKIPIDRQADPTAGDDFGGTAVWSAQQQLDGQNWNTGREILTATGLTDAVSFRWSDTALGDANVGNLLNYSVATTVDGYGEERLEYLRGNDDNEGDDGLGWRDRTHLLGDLIHSAPTYVAPPFLNYPDDLEAAPYSTFKSNNSARDEIVYVGGNDGMLHGFSDETGAEVIAYVPRALYPTLRYLTDPQYEDPASEKHRYYVDASPNVKDAFVDHDGDGDREWRTVLVSGLGAGGRGVFALDVTDPSDFSEANASSIQLWDISAAENAGFGLVADSGTDAGEDAYSFTDLGFTFSEPSIIRLPDNIYGGKWVALFGNGYPAENDLDSGTGTGKAVLYFVDLSTGELLEQVVIKDSAGDDFTDNGLSSPAAVDLDRDNDIDLIYVADLRGNLWRIEPASSPTDGSRWQVSEFGTGSPKPLFSAQTTTDDDGNTVYSQSITVLPEVAQHPDGGQIVLFGTGKYYEKNDDNNTDLQSFYGIWDYYDAFDNPGTFQTIGLSDLQEQSIIEEAIIDVGDDADATAPVAVRFLSDNEVAWWNESDTSGKKGWYLDLIVDGQQEGERVVFNPAIEGDYVVFNTLIPSPSPCDFGGDSYIFISDLLTGGRLEDDVFGLGTVEITLSDGTKIEIPASAIKAVSPDESTIAMSPTKIARVRGGGDDETCGKQLYAVSTSDGNIVYLLTEAPTCAGRKSWIQMR